MLTILMALDCATEVGMSGQRTVNITPRKTYKCHKSMR